MQNAKQKLLRAVKNSISDKEAEEILSYMLIKKKQNVLAKVIGRLFPIPVIELPKKFGPLPEASPITGKGKPPSFMIVRDRR